MADLEGKVALITGGARGQGRSHAVALAEAGANVVVVDIAAPIASVPYGLGTTEDLDETVRAVEAVGRAVVGIRADIRNQQEVDDAVATSIDRFGAIDVVVANAGIWSMNDFWKLSDEEWDDNLAVNLTGHWRTLKAVAPHMIERGSGSIVLISSVNGIEPGPRFAHYCAAKAGLLGLMRNVALELGPHGIRCNAVCPSAMDTDMNKWQGALDMMAGHPGGTLEDRRAVGKHWSLLPGRSMLSPTSTSNAVLWLASDASADVTGIVLPVDAGHLNTPGYNFW